MRLHLRILLASALLSATVARAAVTAAPGYAVHAVAIPGPAVCSTPGSVAGGVVRSGGATLVGWGAFGAGCETVVRLDDSGVTTIATGFNSLGGFDVDRDGRLLVVDNGGEQSGATTGDTLFAIDDPVARTTAQPALGAELAPAGSIGNPQDVVALKDRTALVSDAVGPGAGRVVRVKNAAVTDVVTGLDYTAGLALGPKKTLIVGNVDASFVGEVLRYTLKGKPAGSVATGLGGAYAEAIDGDGDVLVSGSSSVLAFAPGGGSTHRADGFGFSSELWFDRNRDETLVLDFGATSVTAICRDRDGDGVCDVDDDCPLVADAGQTDTDGDGLGDACPCAGPALGKPKLTLAKLAPPAGDDTLSLTATVTAAGPIDPVANGLRLLVRRASGGLLNATIPGGAYDAATKTGWQATSSGFSYKNGLGGVVGITKATLKVAGGVVKVAIKGAGGSWAVAPADLPLSVAVVLDRGTCGAATFATCVPGTGKVACK